VFIVVQRFLGLGLVGEDVLLIFVEVATCRLLALNASDVL